MHTDNVSPIQRPDGLEVTSLPPADDIEAQIDLVTGLMAEYPDFVDAYQLTLECLQDWLAGSERS